MPDIRRAIDEELKEFTETRCAELVAIDSHLAPVAEILGEYILDGGKRFRPIFAYLGFLGAGAAPSKSSLRACAALELVHVCALIHDDVMDGSDARRNRPALHRRFEEVHKRNAYSGDPTKFGVAAAILLGDLALVWSDQLLSESGISPEEFTRAVPVFHQMREELMAGQYLDVLEGALASSDLARSLKIARYKSGRYSIERPLRFGAALAGAKAKIADAYSAFGIPLGEAFQLRDDLLGVFGDPTVTGKPSGDDIREGKRTVLMALLEELVDEGQRKKIEFALGNADLSKEAIKEIQVLIIDSGARSRCEELIDSLLGKALAALHISDIDSRVLEMLRQMADAATKRES